MYIFWKALLGHIQVHQYGGLRHSAAAIRATLTTYWAYNDLDVMIAIPDRNRKELHTEIYNRLRNRNALPLVANAEPRTLLGQVIRDLAPPNPFGVFKLEISSFFACKVVTNTVEPIQWWMDHSGKFKYLSEIAINPVIRPATSVPC